MKNIFKNRNPELTAAERMAIIADVDAENREHERTMHDLAKRRIGGLATGQDVRLEPKDSDLEK